MPIITTKESEIISKHNKNYCCLQKQYYSHQKQTLTNTLNIVPRVVVFKHPLKPGSNYESLISITNNGLHNRYLLYNTDCEDISISVQPQCLWNNFLKAGQSVNLRICLEPKTKLNINRRRHVLIQAEHPNITFSLPIIVMCKSDQILSMQDQIMFPPTCMGTFTFYEMILYNKDKKPSSFTIKCSNPHLTLMVPSFKIAKQSYIQILLKLQCEEMNEVSDVIKLKLGSDCYTISFVHQPLQWTPFCDTLLIEFDPIKFNRSATKSFRICNESKYEIKFDLTFPNEEIETNTVAANNSLETYSSTHFRLEPKCGTIASNSSFLVKVIFKPIMNTNFDTLDNPPFKVYTSFWLNTRNELKCEQREILIKGFINGTDIDIIPKVLDFHSLYFGEQQCAEIEVINIDDITECHVDYLDFSSTDSANIVVTPKEGFDIKPRQSVVFKLQFFAKTIGKFLVKLQFKVKNGNIFSCMVRGHSQQVSVKCFPKHLSFGVVPICVPQKRLVLLMNPLTVPVAIQCIVPEDGVETPLVLDITDACEHLPIDVKDPIHQMITCHRDEALANEMDNCYELGFRQNNETESSLLSFRSVVDDNSSSYSTEFQEQTLDLIPTMAPNLINTLKKRKIFDKPEMETNVMEEALSTLLKTTYFCNMDKYKNYCNMDWNAISTDPKEIYCNDEIIYLSPNTGKTISVVVIPNIIGRQHKYLEVRICPILSCLAEGEESSSQEIVDSKHLISKLSIEYNCMIPEIMWDNVIEMQNALYVGELYEFEMVFENRSEIGGFFHYEIIPDNDSATMRFLNNRWKYFLEPESLVKVPCAVEFKKIGMITLMGMIKFVGMCASFPFHIKSKVLAPNVNFKPQEIVHKISVLKMMKYFVYIENTTPTTTWLNLKLKDDSNVTIYPEGAQLSPNGQGMYVVLNVFFKDPGLYKNTLYINMQYEIVKTLSITFQVDGMPIFVEPDIRFQPVNIGCVLCTTEDEYYNDEPSYIQHLKIINKGERSYRITFTKIKNSFKPSCSINAFKAKITLKPKGLVMKPNSENDLIISANACEACHICNTFRMDIVDLSEPTRQQSYRIVVTAEFRFPQLSWNRREIIMDYCQTHRFKEQPQWEILKLSNVMANFLKLVVLKLTGPFWLKEHFEDRFVKELQFSMIGLETKEFFIMLDKEVIRNRLCDFYEGRLTCFANNKVQKSVLLKVNMFVPKLSLVENDVLLFTKNKEGKTYVELVNTGAIPAVFKWKKIKEESRYINQDDDPKQVAEIILSDILHTLNLKDIDCDIELNATKRYEKCRCYLHKPDDPCDIRNLLYNIIDSLDLTHKRYKLDYHELSENELPCLNNNFVNTKSEDDNVDCLNILPSNFENEFKLQADNLTIGDEYYVNPSFIDNSTSVGDNLTHSSSVAFVDHTLDQVVGHLKLEDSYTISEPSSETCEYKRSVYFFEKSGELQAQGKKLCALHIPPIKKGYEVKATFQLEVIGGKSQELRITFVNCHKNIKLSEDNVYLGVKPWYQNFNARVIVTNTTNYPLNLHLSLLSKTEKQLPTIATGYVNMLNEKSLELSALQSTTLKMEGIMGFSEEFVRKISIKINNSEEVMLRLRGHGIMPMLTIDKQKLAYLKQDVLEIIEDYRLLQKIYYFEIFKTITERDEETIVAGLGEESVINNDLSLKSDLNILISSMKSESDTDSSQLAELYDLIIVDNNEELPNFIILNQLLETEKFLSHLRSTNESYDQLKMVYKNYLQLPSNYFAKMAINLKYFTIQPLPFHTTAQVLQMDKLTLNQYHKFVIVIEYSGPGKIIASARTVLKIPGLRVHFEVAKNNDNLSIYQSDYKTKNSEEISYRNIYERQLDTEIDPKVKHAHSYDFNNLAHHQRNVTAKDRMWLKTKYNSLHKSIYLDQKHHFTHCKIFSNSKCKTSERIFNVIVVVRPESAYYKCGQKIEDYLFIDLHMGATLPILLQGTIVDRIQN